MFTRVSIRNILVISFTVLGVLTLSGFCIVKFIEGTPASFSKQTESASSTIPYVTETERFVAYLQNAVTTSDPMRVQTQLIAQYANALYSDQHMALHYFGEALYEARGTNALTLCKSDYGFGCYHGFLLKAIGTEGYSIVPALDRACREQFGRTMDTETCQHGIGHGLLEYSGRNPHEATDACSMLDSVFPKLGCVSGVFMEHFGPTESSIHNRLSLLPAFNTDEPFNICASYTGLPLATCVFEIQTWWEQIAKFPPKKVEELCNSIPDQEAREFCLIGYGNYKGPYVAKALPFCDQFVQPKSHALCRAGILWSAEHQNDSPEPTSACTDLSPEYRALCFEKGRFTCAVEGNCNQKPLE